MYKIKYVGLGLNGPLKDEIMQAVDSVLTSGQFILGKDVEQFEENIAKYVGTKYAVGVNSGTDALFLCLKAYGIGIGDEVIIPPNSFLATATCVVAAGATPVFVDIGEDLNIDPTLIEEKITSNTKAIMPVHLSGKPAKMNEINIIAKKNGLKIIEDAAQAIGTTYYSKKAGSIGDAGCFSMHPLKTLNACGDAGLITTNDEELYIKLKQLRNIGLKNRNESDLRGYNSRLDNIQAAILNIKLKYLDNWIDIRRKNAKIYTEALKDIVIVPKEEEYEKLSYHTYVIQAENRDELQRYLEENGIETKIHYPIPIHMQKIMQNIQGNFSFLNTEASAQTILSLPINENLDVNDIYSIISILRKFYKDSKYFKNQLSTI